MFIRKRFGGAVGKGRSIFRAVGIAAAAVVFCVGCGNPGGGGDGKDEGGDGGDNGSNPGGYTGSYGSVSYGGKTYKTVKIGNQTWFAENLNYDVPGDTTDVCYNNSADSCAKYGRLYDWFVAMNNETSSSANPSGVQGICPAGWHLPSSAEWTQLMDYVGGSSTAGTKLKATSGWYNVYSYSNGTDEYGFSALPGGKVNSDGYFVDAGYYGIWWSTTENTQWWDYAFYRQMYYGREATMTSHSKENKYSVRCVQN